MVERLSGICESKGKGHSFQGNRGTKAALGNGEHIIFILMERRNMPFYFRGTMKQVFPGRALAETR